MVDFLLSQAVSAAGSLRTGRLAEECLWEAQAENLSEAEVNEAASGNLLTFMVSALNRAAEQKTDEEGE